jgi:phosphoribosylformylglycinamidine synthase
MLLAGSAALTPHRAEQLRNKLSANVEAFHLHAVLGNDQNLELLLKYGIQTLSDHSLQLISNIYSDIPGWKKFLVFPRPGTMSPWSSKATDIAQICGMDIQRIERGIIYFVNSDTVHSHQIPHDRMTHVVFEGIPNLSDLFHDYPPRELKHVQIQSDNPMDLLSKANVTLVFQFHTGFGNGSR